MAQVLHNVERIQGWTEENSYILNKLMILVSIPWRGFPTLRLKHILLLEKENQAQASNEEQ